MSKSQVEMQEEVPMDMYNLDGFTDTVEDIMTVRCLVAQIENKTESVCLLIPDNDVKKLNNLVHHLSYYYRTIYFSEIDSKKGTCLYSATVH